jgi:hypothetical protein
VELLTITCPACNKPSQIDAKSRSKRLRCPYPDCKAAFLVLDNGQTEYVAEVEAEAEAPPRAAGAAAEGQKAKAELRVLDWRAAPPPRRLAPRLRESPASLLDYELAPPPLRRADAGDELDVAAFRPPPRKAAKRIAIFVGLLAVASVVFGGWYFWRLSGESEKALAAAAAKEYADGKFHVAQRSYADLQKRFPSSPNLARYQFMEKLCEIRSALEGSAPEVNRAFAVLGEFLKEYRKAPIYKEYRGDIGEMYYRLIGLALTEAEKTGDRRLIVLATQALVIAEDVGLGADSAARFAELRQKTRGAEDRIALLDARRALLAELDELIRRESPRSPDRAQRLVEAVAQSYPPVRNDAEVRARLQTLEAKELDWIRYWRSETLLAIPLSYCFDTSTPLAAGRLPLITELATRRAPERGEEASLLITPAIQPARKDQPAAAGVVLSIVHGVLYAHDAATGDARWARRIGLDAATLPLRIPALEPVPELLLIVCADEPAVLAVEAATGRTRWTYRLSDRCSAGPLLFGRRVLLPTEDGFIHDLDAYSGRFLGIMELGQPLTAAGAIQPSTRRLFLPAHQRRLYAIDLDKNRCLAILKTEHEPGALRNAPVLAGNTLIFLETRGVDAVRVRYLTLAANPRETKLEFTDVLTVPGWSWFNAFFDGEDLALLTDRGWFALLGVNRGTRDAPLFLRAPAQLLFDVNDPAATAPPRGRPLIVRTELNQWWLLLNSSVYQGVFDPFRQAWNATIPPAPVGTVLHAPQVDGPTDSIVLTTHDAARPRTLITAYAPADLRPRWQRHVGLQPIQEPFEHNSHWYWLDASGGVWELDGAAFARQQAAPRRDANEPLRGTAGTWHAPLAVTGGQHQLIQAVEEGFLVQLSYSPEAQVLVWRKLKPGQQPGPERRMKLAVAPAGMALATADRLLLFCQDGQLYDIPIDATTPEATRLAWRDRDAPADAPAHGVLLSSRQLVVSTGGRKLARFERDAGVDQPWRRMPGDIADDRVAALTTPLAGITVGEQALLVAGDAEGNVTLLSPRNLAAPIVRQWALGGKITAGPFVYGDRIGCVVDHARLVWLDPAQDQAKWTYVSDAGGIRGLPLVFDQRVHVAELGGTMLLLDLEKGEVKARRKPRCQAAPATTPAPLTATLAIVPLLDGTALLLPW